MFLTGHHPTTLRRLAGVLGMALVLVLNVLAVRPDWHEALCHHEVVDAAACAHHHHHHTPLSANHPVGADGSADGCVVTLFAQGHVLAGLLIALLLLIAAVRPAPVRPARLLALASVDYAWPHGCGPPTA